MSDSMMHRREFMRLSSVTVAAAAATTLTPSAVGALVGADSVNPLLSVGFAAESSKGLSLVSASGLSSGDRRFAQSGARVTVHGLERRTSGTGTDVVHLNAMFPNGSSALPVLAWSGSGGDSPRVSFVVPPSEQLTLAVERRRPVSLRGVPSAKVHDYLNDGIATAGIPQRELTADGKGLCVLSIGGAGTKLQRGTYFLALRNRSRDRKPEWSSLTADPATLTLTRFGAPVDFDYLVVSVDYA
jgi:hypothetical protein